MAPITSDMPFTGMSAIPAVGKAAIPQYKALPYDVIVVPSAEAFTFFCRVMRQVFPVLGMVFFTAIHHQLDTYAIIGKALRFRASAVKQLYYFASLR